MLVSEEQFSFGETDFESSLCISDYKAILLQAVCLVQQRFGEAVADQKVKKNPSTNTFKTL